MSTKFVIPPVPLLTFNDNTLESYVADNREVFVDNRGSVPFLRMGDGYTPGGHIVGHVSPGGIVRPVINTPVDNAIDMARYFAIDVIPFIGITTTGTIAVHGETDWQISTDPTFATLSYESANDAVNLTAIDLGAVNAGLESGKTYHIRVRYRDTLGVVSEWSPVVTVSTRHYTAYSLNTTLTPLNQGFDTAMVGRSAAVSGDGQTFVFTGADDPANSDLGSIVIYKRDNAGVLVHAQTISDFGGGVGNLSDVLSKVAISRDGSTIIAYMRRDVAPNLDPGVVVLTKDNTGQYVHSESVVVEVAGIAAFIGVLGAVAVDATGDSFCFRWDGDSSNSIISVYKKNIAGIYTHTQFIHNTATTFGDALAMSGDGTKLFVSDWRYANGGVVDSGIVYEYAINGAGQYVFRRYVNNPAGDHSYEYWGAALALSEDGTVLIGAAPSRTNIRAGAVHVSVLDASDNYMLLTTLSPSNQDAYGSALGTNSDGSVIAIAVATPQSGLADDKYIDIYT